MTTSALLSLPSWLLETYPALLEQNPVNHSISGNDSHILIRDKRIFALSLHYNEFLLWSEITQKDYKRKRSVFNHLRLPICKTTLQTRKYQLPFSTRTRQVIEMRTKRSWLSKDIWASVYELVKDIQMITDLFSSARYRKYILNSKSSNLHQWVPL